MIDSIGLACLTNVRFCYKYLTIQKGRDISGNPLAMSAGIAALDLIRGEGVWRKLEAAAGRQEAGVGEAAKRAGHQPEANRLTRNGFVRG
ncbi:MAG: hypothetical protein ACOYZ6_08585 [Chloroflexota bacterium]